MRLDFSPELQTLLSQMDEKCRNLYLSKLLNFGFEVHRLFEPLFNPVSMGSNNKNLPISSPK
jgi:hypothetical protein